MEGIIQEILSEVQPDQFDSICIESTNIFSALWGELLAKELHCKNMVFTRHELAGIAQQSVSRMLNDDTIPFDDSMHIRAYCNNSIDSCPDEITPLLKPDAELTIGSIGRLDKKYVLPLANRLNQYCLDHSPALYNVVFIGGTRSFKQQKELEVLFQNTKNVNLILTGIQYPIPRSFVDKCDLFISASGSANATYYCKRPTIKLNPESGNPIGIIGLTYSLGEYSMYSSNYEINELDQLIDLAISKKKDIKYIDDMDDGSYTRQMEGEFKRQIQLADLCPELEYFDTYVIKFSSKEYRCFNYLGKIMDIGALYRCLVLARKILK